jgi:hypothetical protein
VNSPHCRARWDEARRLPTGGPRRCRRGSGAHRSGLAVPPAGPEGAPAGAGGESVGASGAPAGLEGAPAGAGAAQACDGRPPAGTGDRAGRAWASRASGRVSTSARLAGARGIGIHRVRCAGAAPPGLAVSLPVHSLPPVPHPGGEPACWVRPGHNFVRGVFHIQWQEPVMTLTNFGHNESGTETGLQQGFLRRASGWRGAHTAYSRRKSGHRSAGINRLYAKRR